MRGFLRGAIPILIVIAALQPGSHAGAQFPGSDKPLMLVLPSGPGAIVLPTGKQWKLDSLEAFENGKRPVALYKWGGDAVAVSFILFQNLSGEPTARGCRRGAIGGIVARLGNAISKRHDSETKAGGGGELAITSYEIDMNPIAPGRFQENLFGFAGNDKACAEIHISMVRKTPESDNELKALFGDFHSDLGYQPAALDYFRLASMLSKKAPDQAVPYYRSSLDAMPKNDSYKPLRRMVTDQLLMSMGLSGDVKASRAVAETGIQEDPDYPLNYYHLACADAENGDAAQAKIHLQQAFDRRGNVLPGERMPDPSKDDCILKLRKNKAFWEFVQKLPKS